MDERARRLRDDGAVSDFVSTILLVGLVVVLGSVIAVVVTATLTAEPPSESSFALTGAAEGSEEVAVVLRHGESVELSALRVTLARNGSAPADVPASTWLTTNATRLRPGDALGLPLAPPLAAGEDVRVRVFRTDLNALVADLGSRAGSAVAPLETPTLAARIHPTLVPADGATFARLTVNVSHPAGALAIGSVVADTSSVALATGSAPRLVPLRDDGAGGDVVGADGVWSGLFALPTGTPLGVYEVVFTVHDATGRPAGTTNATFEAIPGTASGPPSTGESGAVAGSAGAAFSGPTSENVTQLRLRNWTWDQLYPQRVDDDYVTLRIAGSGKTWSARIALTEVGGTAYATQLTVWNSEHETVYTPRNGTRLALEGLDMDLLDPVGSLQWVRASGSADPLALYTNAGISERPTFVVPYFGQDVTTGNQQTSAETGIVSVGVVFV
jgi:hypothetical protein